MKILMINGSPRKKGNTQLILDLFERLLQEHVGVSQDIITVSLREKVIQLCYGCRSCMVNSEEFCPCKDEVKDIENKMKKADLILIGSPVYVEDISGLMKNWIDRMAYHCHRPFLNGKRVYIFTTSGAKASNHSIRTLNHAFLAWGAEVIRCDNYSMGIRMEAGIAKGKFEKQIKKRVQLMCQSKKNIRKRTFSLIAFYVQKQFWIRKGKEADFYDYHYWKSQGWLDKTCMYYHQVKTNVIERFIVKVIGTLIGLILY